MALQPDNTLISNRELIVELLTTPFRALGNLFIKMAENNSRVTALNALNAMSDAELAAKGLTRAEAVALLFRRDA